MKKLQRRLTADKRLRYAPPKLPLATSFIRETLGEMPMIKSALLRKDLKSLGVLYNDVV